LQLVVDKLVAENVLQHVSVECLCEAVVCKGPLLSLNRAFLVSVSYLLYQQRIVED